MSKEQPVSTIVVPPGQPNPFYGRAETMIALSESYLSLQKRVRALMRPGITIFELEALAVEAGLDDDFYSMLSTVRAAPAPPQVIGPGPDSADLYGRVEDGRAIVDVGSGNMMKLKAHSGRLKITAVDPALPEKSVVVAKKERQQLGQPEDRLYTSYNALCQMRDHDKLRDFDGIHVVPDHDFLVKYGKAKLQGDRLYVKAPCKDFLDYKVAWPGAVIKTGYRLVAGFKPRDISLQLHGTMDSSDDWPRDDYRPEVCSYPCTDVMFNINDVGYKWDGTFYECEVSEGEVVVSGRDGRHMRGSTTYDDSLAIHVEFLPPPGACFVLLRIVHYRGFIPPHSGDVLRQFAKAVKVKIDGLPLVGPPVYTGGPARLFGVARDSDGVITRSDEKDFYVKHRWSVDVLEADINLLEEHLLEVGQQLQLHGPRPQGGQLHEYDVKRSSGVVHLHFVRERKDKDKGTEMATVKYLLTLPTFEEMTALYGSLEQN